MAEMRRGRQKTHTKFQEAKKKLIQGEDNERTEEVKNSIRRGLFQTEESSRVSPAKAFLNLYKQVVPDSEEPKSSPLKAFVQLSKEVRKKPSIEELDLIPSGNREPQEAYEFLAMIYQKVIKEILTKYALQEGMETEEEKQISELARLTEIIGREMDLKSLTGILASMTPKNSGRTQNEFSNPGLDIPSMIPEADSIIELMQESLRDNLRSRRGQSRETSIFAIRGLFGREDSVDGEDELESMELNLDLSDGDIRSKAQIGHFDLQKYYMRSGMDNLDLHEIEDLKKRLRQDTTTGPVYRFTYLLGFLFLLGAVIKLALLVVLDSRVSLLGAQMAVLLDLNGMATPVSFFFKESSWLLLNQTQPVPSTGLAIWNSTETDLKSKYQQLFLKRHYIPDEIPFENSKSKH